MKFLFYQYTKSVQTQTLQRSKTSTMQQKSYIVCKALKKQALLQKTPDREEFFWRWEVNQLRQHHRKLKAQLIFSN